jgi:hypothetical protein
MVMVQAEERRSAETAVGRMAVGLAEGTGRAEAAVDNTLPAEEGDIGREEEGTALVEVGGGTALAEEDIGRSLAVVVLFVKTGLGQWRAMKMGLCARDGLLNKGRGLTYGRRADRIRNGTLWPGTTVGRVRVLGVQ